MNEIYNINLWQIVLEGQNKLLPEDTVYQMIIGHSIKEDICEITMFISKINYENLLNGVYHIRVYPYATEKVLLFDEKNNLKSFKDLLNDYLIKGLEPEICFTLYDKDYMIIPLKEKVSFQEVGNKEIFFETIDALFNEKLFNGKSLEDEFENIEKIGWI